jgi:hypothetical protein
MGSDTRILTSHSTEADFSYTLARPQENPR